MAKAKGWGGRATYNVPNTKKATGWGGAASYNIPRNPAPSPAMAPTGPGGAWSTTPLPPDVGGRPLDWQEQAYGLSAGRNLKLASGEAAYQTGQAEQHFGYGASGAANPYSQAALLEESYKRSKLGTSNSYAGQGQLHSGAYSRMQGENQRNYSIQSDANRRAYDDAIHQIGYGQAQAGANYATGMDDASFEALLRALGVK